MSSGKTSVGLQTRNRSTRTLRLGPGVALLNSLQREVGPFVLILERIDEFSVPGDPASRTTLDREVLGVNRQADTTEVVQESTIVLFIPDTSRIQFPPQEDPRYGPVAELGESLSVIGAKREPHLGPERDKFPFEVT